MMNVYVIGERLSNNNNSGTLGIRRSGGGATSDATINCQFLSFKNMSIFWDPSNLTFGLRDLTEKKMRLYLVFLPTFSQSEWRSSQVSFSLAEIRKTYKIQSDFFSVRSRKSPPLCDVLQHLMMLVTPYKMKQILLNILSIIYFNYINTFSISQLLKW